MLRNYFKTALRSLLRQKGFSLLNIVGLTLGMTCCLLLFQYVAYEYSFDRHNERADRLFRVYFETTRAGEPIDPQVNVGYLFGPTIEAEVPDVERFARVHPNYGDAVVSYAGPTAERTFIEERVFFVDPAFVEMFTLPLTHGDPTRALTRPQTLLLSAAMAEKYFGAEDPVGKTLQVTGWVDAPYTVTGVFRDLPPTSHLQFDFLLPMGDLLATEQYTADNAGWGWTNFIVYVESNSRTPPETLAAKLTEVYTRHRAEELAAAGRTAEVALQPLLDIHLNAEIFAPATRTSDRTTVYFFLVIGLLILVIALFNYINLATARAVDRAREVGVRKVVGAQRRQLMGQFLLESGLVNAAALALALGLSFALVPTVNRVAEIELSGALWLDARFWALFIGVFLAGALLSGLYPAFVLSGFRPVSVLKGRRMGAGGVTLRRVLVVAQFAASIVLLVGTAIVLRQMDYMRTLDTGLELEQILVVEGPRVRPENMDQMTSMEAFKNEIRELPAVSGMASSIMVPGRGFNLYTMMHRATADESTARQVRATGIDEHFLDVYGLTLVAGEPFREGMAGGFSENDQPPPVLVNETLVRTMGFASAEEAVGQQLSTGGGTLFTIRGVLEDFNWSSAHQPTETILLFYEPAARSVSVEVATADLPGTVEQIRTRFDALFPGNPFVYYFADESFDAQYKNDERFARLFGAFAAMAILIACLGLFGLAAFTAESRTKEIGVRKVLGATVPSIVALLSRDFLKLVGFAFLLGAPAAYLLMTQWLDGFAYRVEIGPDMFILSGVLALSIALATVSVQSIRAATADPARTLRYE